VRIDIGVEKRSISAKNGLAGWFRIDDLTGRRPFARPEIDESMAKRLEAATIIAADGPT
jgi:hypothetical protein